MDLLLHVLDRNILTPCIYPSSWSEDNIYRQFLTLYMVTTVGGWFLYMGTATFAYIFLFDKRYKLHPNFLSNQERLEIACATRSFPFISLATTVMFILEVRGYSKLYLDGGTESTLDKNGTEATFPMIGFLMEGWTFILLSIFAFLMFTDCLIYWIHRGLHHRLVYKLLHKVHHKWKVPTPYASHALHPLDAFLQGLPYHLYPFLFPLHKVVYLILFVAVNIWAVSIHDGDYRVPLILEPFINGSAHHTDHHVLYKYNYGQFFTLWDRVGGSFHFPSALSGNSLLDEVEKLQKKNK